MHSSRSYSKIQVPYQWTPEEKYTTFRAKIDLQNFIKRLIKYIWQQSTLSDERNGLTIGSKFACFVGLTCTYTQCTGHELVKMEVCVLANFSKTAERNKTLFTGIQVRLKLSSNQQTDQKSVNSTRRYSNIKVPYQMTKKAEYSGCRAKIDYHNSVKRHGKYIWGYSPLTEDSKTLTFISQISCFVVPKIGSSRTAQKFDFFQI